MNRRPWLRCRQRGSRSPVFFEDFHFELIESHALDEIRRMEPGPPESRKLSLVFSQHHRRGISSS
jgi:hypothetical protein